MLPKHRVEVTNKMSSDVDLFISGLYHKGLVVSKEGCLLGAVCLGVTIDGFGNPCLSTKSYKTIQRLRC